ncbi:MAG TPA: kelch repeat-containing protein, partial [Terrimicrobiaceae bacterium]|nr:kelch repeat-containing protein [Terrimicrobiaceae bacterium]
MNLRGFVGLALMFLGPDLIRAQVAGASEEGHECVLGGAPAENPLQPTMGRFETTRATVVPATERGQEAAWRFDRTARKDERCIATLARPLRSGEHLRVIVSARLESGRHLQFGFGSDDGGQLVDGALLTAFVALLEKGKIACYDGSSYRVLRGIKHPPGEWQTFAIDYVVGSDQLLLTAGGNQTAVKVPFVEIGGPPKQVNRVFVSTGANDTKGEMKGLRAYVVAEPAVSELPVFGSIRWTRREVPFIKPGPRAGFSGAGFAAAAGKLFLMGGFIPDGDGTSDKGGRSSRWAFSYDPETDKWEKLPDLPGRREYENA